jgi:hypothetical protein
MFIEDLTAPFQVDFDIDLQSSAAGGGDPLVEIDGEYAVADAFQDGAAGGFECGCNAAECG